MLVYLRKLQFPFDLQRKQMDYTNLTLFIFIWIFFHPDDQTSVSGVTIDDELVFGTSSPNKNKGVTIDDELVFGTSSPNKNKDGTIKVKSGQDVILTSRAPNNNITVVKWSRADLGDEYVLLYQDEQFVPDNQHPSFKNRVDLQDRQMKDGDVSLILSNVTINDTGTYECHVAENSEKNMELISHTSLRVADKFVTAESGQDITLRCRDPNHSIRGVKWIRPDLGEEYVLWYIDGHFLPEYQHPSFKNRVDLQDRQMKDGDVSLILKDVTINDAETYVCGVLIQQGGMKLGIHLSVVVPPDQKNITAESGQDVTLTCRAPNNNIRVVKWSRADLEDEYVLLFQKHHFDPANQHPSYKNQVDLQDRQMKDGDVSLILKDVTINDAGTYVCGDYMEETRSWKSISIINLRVLPPPGPPRGIIGLIVVILLLLVGVGF